MPSVRKLPFPSGGRYRGHASLRSLHAAPRPDPRCVAVTRPVTVSSGQTDSLTGWRYFSLATSVPLVMWQHCTVGRLVPSLGHAGNLVFIVYSKLNDYYYPAAEVVQLRRVPLGLSEWIFKLP